MSVSENVIDPLMKFAFDSMKAAARSAVSQPTTLSPLEVEALLYRTLHEAIHESKDGRRQRKKKVAAPAEDKSNGSVLEPGPFLPMDQPANQPATAVSEHQDLKDLFGHTITEHDQSVQAAARSYLLARKRVEEADGIAKAARANLDNVENNLLRIMDQAGCLSTKLEIDGEKAAIISASTTTYYSTPKESFEKEDFFEWMASAGGIDLIKKSVHHSTFSSFCKELKEAGKTLHPEVKTAVKRIVSLRRS